ncbi:MAG: glycine-rich protein, partial [Saprospiraceae bacterium]
ITVNPVATTTYTVTITNSCTIVISVTITVNPAPVAAISVMENSGLANNDGIICGNASATLTASGGGTYLWSTGETTASITVSPIITTTYTVTVTSVNGCSATATQTITVSPLPSAGITVMESSGTTNNDGTICSGASATLTATGTGTYMWSTGATTNSITVSPTMTTAYMLTVTNANNCSSTATQIITVNPLPTAAITPANPTICSGQSVTLTASGGTTYVWSTGATTAAISVNPTSTTVYSVTVTNANGCTATTSTTVNVNASPTYTVVVTQPTSCFTADGSITLTITGGVGPYTFNWFTANGCSVAQGQQNQMALCVGTYNVTVTGNNGCTSTSSIVLNVPGGCGGCSTLTSVTVSPDSICAGSTTTFTANGGLPGATYAWYDMMTGGNLVGTGNPLVSGPLAVSTTYCVEQTVNVNNTVTFDYAGTPQTFVVPAGVTSLTIQAFGAEGGAGGTNGGAGGAGGSASGTLAVVPGQTLNIYVGQKGGQGNFNNSGAGGFNGGGNGGGGSLAGGGGGASDVRVGGNALANRVIIAGGGAGVGGAQFAITGGTGGGLS